MPTKPGKKGKKMPASKSAASALEPAEIQEARRKLGENPHALEYLVAWYVLRGHPAARVKNRIAEDIAELKTEMDGINQTTILDVVRGAIQKGVIQLKSTEHSRLAEALHDCYLKKGSPVKFRVADDSIGFRHANLDSPFFWEVAADALGNCLQEIVLDHQDAPGEIIIVNTGGSSVAKTVRQLATRTVAPEFRIKHGGRMVFLSLSAAGSSHKFDSHSNFVATLLSQAYGASHHAVVAGKDDARLYDKRVENMHLIVSGLGGKLSYLMNWMGEHNVPQPSDGRVMEGDIFLNPLVVHGTGQQARLTPYEENQLKNLQPLKLRPTYEELQSLLNKQPRMRALIIVVERRKADGSLEEDKCEVLHTVLKANLVTDCVLGSNLAIRLLKKNGCVVPDDRINMRRKK